MKKAILLFILIGITFLGCRENLDNSILTTSTESENLTFSPQSNNEPNITTTDNQSLLYVSQLIDGVNGGFFMIDTTYVNYQGRDLYVHGEITVLQNAFQDTTEITMILNPEEATVQFLPHMVFDREVRISVEYIGIDLKELGYKKNGKVDFAFFDDDGSTEIIQAQQSHVNVKSGAIKVLNAKLYHFSRYGWLR